MASAPRVGPSSASAGVSAVNGWSGPGQRFSSADNRGGAAALPAVRGGWHPDNDDRHGQGYFFFGQYPEKPDRDPPLFTPFMSLRASSFAAIDPVSDIRSAAPVLFADILRGVGIYDLNLKVIAGTLATQGAVLNRYG